MADDTDVTYTHDDVVGFDAELLRQAQDIVMVANREVAEDIADRMSDAMDAQPCTKADAFLAMVLMVVALLSDEHCGTCRRVHGARLISLACAALDTKGTRH